jgi:DNA-binding NtrC family response regulator
VAGDAKKGLNERTEEAHEPDRARGARLLIFGPSAVSSRPLPDGGSLLIGRMDPAEVVIDDKAVSRSHARIGYYAERAVPDRFWIEDLGSSNGTRVRGRRIEPSERHSLEPGDLVEIGLSTLVVQDSAEAEAAWVRAIHADKDRTAEIIEDPAMQKLYDLVDRVAMSEISVLILGETGVGKEVMARAIHDRSARSAAPFLAINCGAISETLIESELFGHEKGAFTGAATAKPGLLELAQGGTVFLDEVGELPKATQVRLLRVLEDRRVWRVGGVENRTIDVRFVSATHRDLKAACASGEFRRDLFYRLNGISFAIPPLRERRKEIAPLARSFVRAFAGAGGPMITARAIGALEAHDWPGNIRELRNVVERAVALAQRGEIEVEHLQIDAEDEPRAPPQPHGAPLSNEMKRFEKERIAEALEKCHGNQTKAAKMLGISRKVLLARLDEFELERPRKNKKS